MPDLCIHEVHRCTICHPTVTGTTPSAPLSMTGQRSHPFTARYDGECAGCGFDIRAGETVRYETDGQLHHARCSDG